jgi:hypothetical protein
MRALWHLAVTLDLLLSTHVASSCYATALWVALALIIIVVVVIAAVVLSVTIIVVVSV